MHAKQKVLEGATKLIGKAGQVLATTQQPGPNVYAEPWVDRGVFAEWKSQAVALLTRVEGTTGTYLHEFKTSVQKPTAAQTKAGLGILRAFKEDVETGALQRFSELLHAELFAELLADAEHLLAEGYLLAAAVITGATLEGHVRKLADKHGLATADPSGQPIKTANLNDQLTKASVYSRADHDQISGWLRIRNEAAHNEPAFAARTPGEIRLMIDGTRGVVARIPA